MICPNCKIIVPESAEFCQRCQSPVNERSLERTIKAEKPKEMLICPKCGALHTPTAKFCRNDGTPLSKKNPEQSQPRLESKSKKGLSLKNLIISTPLVILLLFLSYLFFWTKKEIKDSSEVQTIDAINIVPENRIEASDEKGSFDFAIIEVEINRTLRKKGIESIYVEVDKDLKATITGYFNQKADKHKTLSILAAYKEIKEVVDNTKKKTHLVDNTKNYSQLPQISTAKLKDDIEKALKDRGINSVTVDVDNSFYVTLKGVVKNMDEKRSIFEVAGFYKDIKRIKDLVFVVEH
jgi:ribosomal protein L40E/transcriptional regulator of NAD metabolism